jgi:hypothetical protein
MRESEVAALLGAPPGDYRTNKAIDYLFVIDASWPPAPPGTVEKDWLTDECMIRVWFGPNGKTVNRDCGTGMPPPTWIKSVMKDIRHYLPFLP